jgi:hypothetical protein
MPTLIDANNKNITVSLLVNVLTAGEGLRLATILAPRVLKDQPLKISAEH